ncbi:MAG: hypothetical protein V1904_08600 [Bacteroidota bacterium]
MKKYFFHRDTFRVIIFIFLVIFLLNFITFNISPFNPINKFFKELDFTDIVYSKIRNNDNIIDANIVLINIGNASRDTIALAIDRAGKSKAKVIGVDILFGSRKDSVKDSILKTIIARYNNLIFGSKLSGKAKDDKDLEVV